MTIVTEFPRYKTSLVSDLIPYARNSRTHSEQQVGKIAASIKEFGFLNPVIVDGSNSIVAGHGRILAAQKLGMTEVPVIEAAHLTDAQRRAYIIADNKLALNAGWDDELLKIEFVALEEADFDLGLTGFSDEETFALLGDGLPEDDPKEPDFNPVFEVVVSCQDESEQEAIYSMMTAKGLKCRVLSM
jgi:ParB-like chromosome segregation protein Spo0J